MAQGRPASGPWPANPFPRGNTTSLTHGIWSGRKVNPPAKQLAEGLLEDRPDLSAYPETVWAWARSEARCLILEEWLSDHWLIDEEGNAAPVARYVGQFERLAAELRTKLGLDPKSEAELVAVRAQAARGVFDIEALRQRGREALELRVSG